MPTCMMVIFLSACLELARTILDIKYSEQFVCEAWKLQSQQKRQWRRMSTEMPEGESGERALMSREAEGNRAAGLVSGTGLGCLRAGPWCHVSSLKAA